MKYTRKILCLLMACILTVGLLPCPVQAVEDDSIHITYHYDNPLYHSDSARLEDTVPESKAAIADPAAVSAAADQLRNDIKSRKPECVIQIQTSGYDEDSFRAMMRAIADEAEIHTGVPTEGDYIMWQYASWDASASGSSSNGVYNWTLSYVYSYYTTAEEEAQVDRRVKEVLNNLNVGSASDYEKVKAIYDYICNQVTYDYDHLDDNSYKHQFTAYAALIQGTSVCQGYALLFYRMALELGVDARLIAGSSRGEGHGWNIVQLGNQYYNADTTWDAVNTNYVYFLKCPSNFPDHIRDSVYDTAEFHNVYPMASSDYQPGMESECQHSHQSTILDATCTDDGLATYTCTKCGETTTEVIEKLGHDYHDVITEPTCASGGYTLHICSRCSDSYTDTETPALEHTWDEGTVTQEPTDTQPGVMTYECINCDASKTESITCSHKSYNSVTTDPTCTAEGQTVYTCTNCGYSYTETIAKLPHQWDEGTITKEPTATEAGEKTQHCATCDNLRITKIPATGKVFRLQGGNRYETAFKVADHLKVATTAEKFYNVIIASGTSFADALAGSYLASQYQGPILLVNKHTVQDVADYIFENAHPGARVFILGGEAAVPATMDALLENDFDVRRLAGANRYETNLRILQAAGINTGEIMVCTGRDFADSLSVSALGKPILLVNKTLSDSQKEWLSSVVGSNVHTVHIIGGTNAVATNMEAEFANIGFQTIDRISGSNRYETSAMVAETFFPIEANHIVLAYGQNFPDGLCGGVLAYNMYAPLILTRDKAISYAVDFATSRGVTTGAVLGGTGLIADSSVRQVFSMGESDFIVLQ